MDQHSEDFAGMPVPWYAVGSPHRVMQPAAKGVNGIASGTEDGTAGGGGTESVIDSKHILRYVCLRVKQPPGARCFAECTSDTHEAQQLIAGVMMQAIRKPAMMYPKKKQGEAEDDWEDEEEEEEAPAAPAPAAAETEAEEVPEGEEEEEGETEDGWSLPEAPPLAPRSASSASSSASSRGRGKRAAGTPIPGMPGSGAANNDVPVPRKRARRPPNDVNEIVVPSTTGDAISLEKLRAIFTRRYVEIPNNDDTKKEIEAWKKTAAPGAICPYGADINDSIYKATDEFFICWVIADPQASINRLVKNIANENKNRGQKSGSSAAAIRQAMHYFHAPHETMANDTVWYNRLISCAGGFTAAEQEIINQQSHTRNDLLPNGSVLNVANTESFLLGVKRQFKDCPLNRDISSSRLLIPDLYEINLVGMKGTHKRLPTAWTLDIGARSFFGCMYAAFPWDGVPLGSPLIRDGKIVKERLDANATLFATMSSFVETVGAFYSERMCPIFTLCHAAQRMRPIPRSAPALAFRNGLEARGASAINVLLADSPMLSPPIKSLMAWAADALADPHKRATLLTPSRLLNPSADDAKDLSTFARFTLALFNETRNFYNGWEYGPVALGLAFFTNARFNFRCKPLNILVQSETSHGKSTMANGIFGALTPSSHINVTATTRAADTALDPLNLFTVTYCDELPAHYMHQNLTGGAKDDARNNALTKLDCGIVNYNAATHHGGDNFMRRRLVQFKVMTLISGNPRPLNPAIRNRFRLITQPYRTSLEAQNARVAAVRERRNLILQKFTPEDDEEPFLFNDTITALSFASMAISTCMYAGALPPNAYQKEIPLFTSYVDYGCEALAAALRVARIPEQLLGEDANRLRDGLRGMCTCLAVARAWAVFQREQSLVALGRNPAEFLHQLAKLTPFVFVDEEIFLMALSFLHKDLIIPELRNLARILSGEVVGADEMKKEFEPKDPAAGYPGGVPGVIPFIKLTPGIFDRLKKNDSLDTLLPTKVGAHTYLKSLLKKVELLKTEGSGNSAKAEIRRDVLDRATYPFDILGAVSARLFNDHSVFSHIITLVSDDEGVTLRKLTPVEKSPTDAEQTELVRFAAINAKYKDGPKHNITSLSQLMHYDYLITCLRMTHKDALETIARLKP